MPYHYLDDVAIADIAFEAYGESKEEMFIAASDALMNVMVEDLVTIKGGKAKVLGKLSEGVIEI